MPVAIVKYVKAFCEKHLIADDPYQFEHLSPDQLVDTKLRYFIEKIKYPVLDKEIQKRLEFQSLTYEEREILTKSLEWK